MNLHYLIAILGLALSANLAHARIIYTEISQSCKNINWNVNSTESESSFLVSSGVYQSLLRPGPKGTIIPNLAKNWEIIDPKTVRFTLKDNVYFSNGKKLESIDAKLSMNDILSKTDFTKIILGNVESVEIIDSTKFYLKLRKPDPLILQKISVFFRLYYLRDETNIVFASNKIVPGTGPWKISSMTSAQYIFEPSFKSQDNKLIVFCNSNGFDKKLLSKIEKEDLVLIDNLSNKSQLDLRKHFKLNIVETSEAIQTFGIFNLLSDNEAIKDSEIRKAINYSIDRSAFSRLVLKNQGYMLPGLSLTNEVGHNDLSLYPHKIKIAKNIVKKWLRQNKRNSVTLRVGLQSQEDNTLNFVDLLKFSLQRIGIKLILNTGYSVEKQTAFRNDIDLIFGSDPSPYFHMDFLIRNFYLPSSIYYVGTTKELGDEILKIDSLADNSDIEEQYKKIDKYLYDNFLGIPGFQLQKIRAFNGDISEISSQGPLLDFSIISSGRN